MVLQRAYRYGYATEFLGWCLNRSEFLEYATRTLGLRLEREFLVDERVEPVGAPESAQFAGFLFSTGSTA